MGRFNAPKGVARVGAVLAAALALASVLGTVRWIARERPITMTPALAADVAPRSAGGTNLASIQRGTVVRASSWDWFRRHHPLFVIDEEPHPTLVEKWASAPSDRAPWIEVRLARPALVRRVVLVFAVGHASPVVRSYTLHCLAGARSLATQRVDENKRPEVSHELLCDGADAVRVEFHVAHDAPDDVARLFELEVWGRP